MNCIALQSLDFVFLNVVLLSDQLYKILRPLALVWSTTCNVYSLGSMHIINFDFANQFLAQIIFSLSGQLHTF